MTNLTIDQRLKVAEACLNTNIAITSENLRMYWHPEESEKHWKCLVEFIVDSMTFVLAGLKSMHEEDLITKIKLYDEIEKVDAWLSRFMTAMQNRDPAALMALAYELVE